MTIHPADQTTAFLFLHQSIADLLCWATHPHPEPLGDDWLESVKADLRSRFQSAEQSAQGDELLIEDIHRAQRLAFEFATLLCQNPTLSTVRVQDWGVPRFRDVFDDLHVLDRKFERLSGVSREGETPGATPSADDDLSPLLEKADWMELLIGRRNKLSDDEWTVIVRAGKKSEEAILTGKKWQFTRAFCKRYGFRFPE